MKSNQFSKNKTIAKNAVLLYLRMLLSIIVTLYTSRIVLQTLGVNDYGIYGIVGGVVLMFSFFNASMSGSTSRFLTFELGRKGVSNLKEIFSTALIIHICIALVVLLLGETVGLWFIYNKLNIPADRFSTALLVYQLSLISMFFTVTQVPYNATIIAHEKMDVYAYVELLNVFLKLAIVFLLRIFYIDKLLLYALLTLFVTITIALIYRFYCIKNYPECKFKFTINREILYPMLNFSGWDLYGNMSSTFKQQGINLIINMFFGVALNAAGTIATNVQSVVSSLSTNVIQAFRPQIIKNYANNEIKEMELLMCRSLKFTLLLFLAICIPLSLEIELVFKLWLGVVPEYAVHFSLILLWTCLFNLINNVINIGIHATGNVKGLSFISGTIHLLTLLLIYLFFKLFGGDPSIAYIISICVLGLIIAVDLLLLKKNIPSINITKLLVSIATPLLFSFVAFIPCFIIYLQLEDNIFRCILISLIFIFSLALLTFFYAIEKENRQAIINRVKLKK